VEGLLMLKDGLYLDFYGANNSWNSNRTSNVLKWLNYNLHLLEKKLLIKMIVDFNLILNILMDNFWWFELCLANLISAFYLCITIMEYLLQSNL
jgi:hypothetical protein